MLPAGKTPVDAQSWSCSLFCKKGWSKGCLPPLSKCMLPLLPHITMQYTASLWGSTRSPLGPDGLDSPDGLQSVELKPLSLKTVLLIALASVKRVGDLQAFSVDDSCLEFRPGDSHVVLRPQPGYVPKVPTTPFRDQVVNLQALPREEADPAIALLCPVRALCIYVDHTQGFRTSDQLFVCFGGQQRGKAVSKQRLAHWISGGYSLGIPGPALTVPPRNKSTLYERCSSSWALARGASIADICRAAGWATPNTFERFYNLRVKPVSSRLLSSCGQ